MIAIIIIMMIFITVNEAKYDRSHTGHVTAFRSAILITQT